MSRTVAYAVAALLFAAGTLLLVTADSWRRRRDENRMQTIQTAPDETWKSQDLLVDYKLIERSGRLFDSQELDGRVHVVSFFFTACPGPCFRQNSQVQLLHEVYAEKGVRFVSLTCDPDRDTPAVMTEYARRFRAGDDTWLFLTGDLEHLRRVAAEVYRVPVDKETHTEKLLVVDRQGRLRGGFHWNKPEELAAMRLLLNRLLVEPPEAYDEELKAKQAEARAAAERAEADEQESDGAVTDAGSSDGRATGDRAAGGGDETSAGACQATPSTSVCGLEGERSRGGATERSAS